MKLRKDIRRLVRDLLAAADEIDAGVLVLTPEEKEMKREILHRAFWADRPALRVIEGGRRTLAP